MADVSSVIVTTEEALQHLGIDYADEVVLALVNKKLETAIKTMHGAVGADVEVYLPGDPRITELVLIYLEDLYSQRGMSAKVSGATRRLVSTIELQLVMELRTAKEVAGV
jgi:hypothetical protein